MAYTSYFQLKTASEAQCKRNMKNELDGINSSRTKLVTQTCRFVVSVLLVGLASLFSDNERDLQHTKVNVFINSSLLNRDGRVTSLTPYI